MKIENIKNTLFAKFASGITIVALLLLMTPFPAKAAGLTQLSDTMSRQKVSTLSTHRIKFKSTSAIGVGTAGVTLSFPTASAFTITTPVVGDIVGICHGASTGLENGYSSNCTANNETISGTASANNWGFSTSGTSPVLVVLAAPVTTFTNTIAAGDFVTIFISAVHFTNPSAASTPTISITTTSDTGSLVVPILDDDSVSVTASVGQSITFSIKAATTNTGSAPYTVPLGTLLSTAPTGSNNSTVNSIFLNIATSAANGAIVTVSSANASLKSTSTPADTIPATGGTMANGSALYGLCIKSVTQSGGATLTKAAGFPSTTCTTTPAGNTVGALTVLPISIVTAASPISGGIAEVFVNAENSITTPAHNDYTDTLTFVGTATY